MIIFVLEMSSVFVHGCKIMSTESRDFVGSDFLFQQQDLTLLIHTLNCRNCIEILV